MRIISIIKYIGILLYANFCFSAIFEMHAPDANIIGEVKKVRAKGDETLVDLALEYGIGYYDIVEANPAINPSSRIEEKTEIIIPSQYILPPGPRQGIVINLAELRLYYYHPNKKEVFTGPVGVGREGWETPIGVTKITTKINKPNWYPPASVRKEAEASGDPLPKVVLPGPDNPLGEYAIGLGWKEYFLHGTNMPKGVGRPSSAGCIRMYPEDIETLFPMVSIGTSFRVVDAPVKVGAAKDELYIESHAPLHEVSVPQKTIDKLMDQLFKKSFEDNFMVNWSNVQLEITKHTGIPEKVGVKIKV